jgi:hypothetical protein
MTSSQLFTRKYKSQKHDIMGKHIYIRTVATGLLDFHLGRTNLKFFLGHELCQQQCFNISSICPDKHQVHLLYFNLFSLHLILNNNSFTLQMFSRDVTVHIKSHYWLIYPGYLTVSVLQYISYWAHYYLPVEPCLCT